MGLHRNMLFIFLVITANILDYTYLKYSFQSFLFILYDDLYQYHPIYSCLFIDSRYEKKNMLA